MQNSNNKNYKGTKMLRTLVSPKQTILDIHTQECQLLNNNYGISSQMLNAFI